MMMSEIESIAYAKDVRTISGHKIKKFAYAILKLLEQMEENERNTIVRQLESIEYEVKFDLSKVKGVGRGRLDDLARAGYTEIEHLTNADAQGLLEDLRRNGAQRMGLKRAETMIANAKRLLEK